MSTHRRRQGIQWLALWIGERRAQQRGRERAGKLPFLGRDPSVPHRPRRRREKRNLASSRIKRIAVAVLDGSGLTDTETCQPPDKHAEVRDLVPAGSSIGRAKIGGVKEFVKSRGRAR